MNILKNFYFELIIFPFTFVLSSRKGRMAYVIDLEEEENDLPTTRLRSIHDCPAAESSNDINTSNLLIQVCLSDQIFFSYSW